eukprot:3992447-Pyramimonas_sp.AAC.1
MEQAGRNRWQRLVLRIQSRKRWSQQAQLLKYAKNGCPKKFTEAKGFGAHIGRWSWREISYEW